MWNNVGVDWIERSAKSWGTSGYTPSWTMIYRDGIFTIRDRVMVPLEIAGALELVEF